MNHSILFFKDITKENSHLVGGKGTNLGIMTQAGFPVPNGFCITTETYCNFLEQNNLNEFLSTHSDGAEIRAAFISSPIPDYLEAQVTRALSKFPKNTFFGVRSSATAEDLEGASFAGQQDTYLNVRAQDVLHAVRNCWASLYTDRAIQYRNKNHIPHQSVHMSVVVQKMVHSDLSGILFTADPLTESRNVISIDAGYGLGEALVSGLVSPDIYKYGKRERAILSKDISEKKLAILPLPEGGTKTVDLPPEQAKSQALSDQQITELAQIGLKIEEYYKKPQDIEWCFEDGILYVVQSRPITSLFPLVTPRPKEDGLHTYVSFGHVQMMLAPISPMGRDFLALMTRNSQVPIIEYQSTAVRQAGGRVYIDVSGGLQYDQFQRHALPFAANADALISMALLDLVKRPNFKAHHYRRHGSFKTALKFVKTTPIKVVHRFLLEDTSDTLVRMNSLVKSMVEHGSPMSSDKSGLEKLEIIYDKMAFFKVLIPSALPLLTPGILSMKKLEAMEREAFGEVTYTPQILKGLEGNITTEMGLWVGDLADEVRASQALRREFENENYDTFYERIAAIPDHDTFKALLKKFLDIYGCRAAGEIDVATPRFSDQADLVAKTVLSMVYTTGYKQHRKEFDKTVQEAKAAIPVFIEAIREKLGKTKANEATKLIIKLRNCLPVREHPKYIMMRNFELARTALLEVGDELVAAGKLTQRNDIFMIGFFELYRLMQLGVELKKLVVERKEEMIAYAKLTPPRVLTSDGEIIRATYAIKDLPPGAIVGIAASSGVVEGVAKIIFDPTKATVDKGEILVAPYTDPGWTTLFVNAAAVVTEVGGMLTHGTVVAREYGIPAVVGAENATTLIKTGQKIRVDGNSGYVMVLGEDA